MGYPLLASIFLSLTPTHTAPPFLSSQKNLPNTATASRMSFSKDFATGVKSTMDEVSKLLSLLATFSGIIGSSDDDLHASSVIQDCVNLLDLSSENSNFASTDRGATEHRLYDLQAWLSDAQANQGTCSDRIEGTDNEMLKGLVMGPIRTITSLLTDVLLQIPSFFRSSNSGQRNMKLMSNSTDGMPYWLGTTKRHLLQAPASSIQADAVVAADRSRDYASVSKVMEAAPKKSTRRFIIHVKSGVYNKNMEI